MGALPGAERLAPWAVWGLLAPVVLWSACATTPVYVSKDYYVPEKIAVLPMANSTNDLDGPPLVRKMLFDHLVQRGYEVMPLEQVDERLKEKGFTEGGQLRATTPQKLGEWLEVDGLFYSALEDFNYINIGFYWARKVKVSGRLVDAGNGERLWEAERAHATTLIVTDKKEAQRQFAIQLAAKALEKMTHMPLQPESRIAVELLLETLPSH